MKYVEVTVDEAIKLLKNSKSKKILVAIQDLENNESSMFHQKHKNDCIKLFEDVETTISVCDDFMNQLRLFTEKQNDIMNIEQVGVQKIILFK